jgi:hypothetical protein
LRCICFGQKHSVIFLQIPKTAKSMKKVPEQGMFIRKMFLRRY